MNGEQVDAYVTLMMTFDCIPILPKGYTLTDRNRKAIADQYRKRTQEYRREALEKWQRVFGENYDHL